MNFKLKKLFLRHYLSQSVYWLGWALSMLVCGIFADPKDTWTYFGLSTTGVSVSVGISTLGNRMKKNGSCQAANIVESVETHEVEPD